MSVEIKDNDSEDVKAKEAAIKSQKTQRKYQDSKAFKRETKTEVMN